MATRDASTRTPAPPRPRRLAFWLVLAFLTLLLLGAAALLALWHSPALQQRLLQQVPGLQPHGVEGRATGGPFAVERLVWQGAGVTVVVEQLSWRDAQWRWRPHDGAWIGLRLDTLRARSLSVRTSGEDEAASPAAPPQSLRLPIEFVTDGAAIGTLQWNDFAPLRQLRTDLHLGAQQGAEHRLRVLQALWPPYAVAGEASIGTAGELPLTARLGLANAPGTPSSWRAGVHASGPLQRLPVNARLDTDAADAVLQAEAILTPWTDAALAALALRANGLDLRALAPALPHTRLHGSATLDTPPPPSASALPFTLELRNEAAGPWDVARVPLRTVQGTLGLRLAQAQQPLRATLESLTAELGSAEQPAGRLQGRAEWAGASLDARLQLDAVQPARLDTRAPPMRLDGPIELALQGLDGSVPIAGRLQAQLQGRLPGRASALALEAQARFEQGAADALTITLPQLALRAGDARATASAELRRDAGRWQLDSRGELARFDPGLWWPALAARRDTQLNARWQAALQWPQGALALDALRGQAELVLGASRLAGVPLAGRAALQAGAGDAWSLDGQARAGANRFAFEGRALHAPDRARWQFDIDAPALQALAPLRSLAIVPAALQAWLPRSGALRASGNASGRWPALRTEGSVQARALEADAFVLERADARWRFGGLAVTAPLSLQLDAAGLAAGARRLDRLQARLDGTPGRHRLTLVAASPLRPPAWTETLTAPSQGGSRAELSAQGAWTPLAQGSRWQGTLQRLVAAPRDAPQQPWLAARDIEATLRLDARARLESATLAPGAIAAFGGGLRWQEASWQAGSGGADARFTLDAQLQPLRVAPLLARLQPRFGWRGDLALGGPIRLRRTPALQAEVVLERSGAGDLSLVVDGTRRELGLSDLRLALDVRDGRWQLTQALAGHALGVLGGWQVVRAASPQALWPAPDAPLQGSVELRVAELANLSPWLPAGWSLGGNLRLSAALGGRLGDPALRGELVGSALSVRNLFEGVSLRDGVLRVLLSPEQANVEQLVFRGGDGQGTLRADGVLRFDATPQARLEVVAEQFRALDRFDRRITLSGRASVLAGEQGLAVAGRLRVDSGLIDLAQQDAPALDADVVVINRPGAPAAGADATRAPSALGALRLDLTVDLGDALRLQGRGLETRLAGQLHFTSPQDQLVVTGVVRTVEGTYSAYGQNLVIDRGILTFTGEVANPRIDVVALRPDIDVRVGVVVSGRAVDPRVRLFSEPEMAEIDQLTWLLLGRAPEGLGRADTALLQRAALALLAGERGGSGSNVLQRLGIDELSVERAASGQTEDTVVGIGKQLSSRLFIGYERALSAAGGTWQLIYRVAGRLTLRLQAGVEESVDAIWTWRWD